jgi:polyhydroxybutyrate depolymerase
MRHRRAAAFVALLAVLVAGLAVPAAAAGWITTTVSFTSGGRTRLYLVERPAEPGSASLPVVVELHGCCTTPSFELTRSGFETAARGAILVFPAGYQEVWNAGACCGDSQADDVSFIAAVVERVLASSPRADPSRVYLVGYSNGGRMAYRVACERPGLFAAVAVFGAVDAFACGHRSPVPILLAAGTDDPELVVTYGFAHVVNGYAEPTLTQEALSAAVANGCARSTVTSSATVSTTTWAACSSGSPVVLMRYLGAAHDWPAGMAAVMWRFFTGIAAARDSSRV